MFKSVSGVFFKNSFLPELFFNNFSNVNGAFAFLNNGNCLENLIYSGCSDFKLIHPEFWRHSIQSMDPEKKELLKNVLGKHNIQFSEFEPDRWLCDFREKGISEELKDDLVKTLFPESLNVNNPFIKNLGKLYFSRAAIPFIQRKEAFNFLHSSFWKFGATNGRLSHIPISVNPKYKCKIIIDSNDINELKIENNILYFGLGLRIHIFPHGLISIYFQYSITGKELIRKQEIVIATKKLLSKDKSISILFNNKKFSSMQSLFDFVMENIFNSIYKSKSNLKVSSSRIYSFQTLNFHKEKPVSALENRFDFHFSAPRWRTSVYKDYDEYLQKMSFERNDILEMLNLDLDNREYDSTFFNSYSSLLGKYQGDFVFATSEKIIMSLTTQWKNYRKRKTRIRYYWLFIHLFQFTTSMKFLSRELDTILQDGFYNNNEINDQHIKIINQWVLFSSRQHFKINPLYRKFYYKVSKIQSVKESLTELTNRISMNHKSRSITQIYPEQIDEFSKSSGISNAEVSDKWMLVMESLSESIVKEKICEILGDIPKKDWGGELNDHFTTLHLNGIKYSAGFILKGPAKFQEMQPSHLGKNADQIWRLNSTPCDIMVIQHCHMIGEAVKATVQAFASLSSSNRMYCLIDGRDTYKILKAYGKI